MTFLEALKFSDETGSEIRPVGDTVEWRWKVNVCRNGVRNLRRLEGRSVMQWWPVKHFYWELFMGTWIALPHQADSGTYNIVSY